VQNKIHDTLDARNLVRILLLLVTLGLVFAIVPREVLQFGPWQSSVLQLFVVSSGPEVQEHNKDDRSDGEDEEDDNDDSEDQPTVDFAGCLCYVDGAVRTFVTSVTVAVPVSKNAIVASSVTVAWLVGSTSALNLASCSSPSTGASKAIDASLVSDAYALTVLVASTKSRAGVVGSSWASDGAIGSSVPWEARAQPGTIRSVVAIAVSVARDLSVGSVDGSGAILVAEGTISMSGTVARE